MVEDAFVAFVAITLTALFYTVVSNYVMRRWGDRERVKQIQDEMNRINKMMQDAIRRNDEKKKALAEKEQEKLPELLKESMILQFKPLVFTLPVFFVLTWVLRELFPFFVIRLSVSIPVFVQNLDRFPNWRNEFGVTGWFILSLIFMGLLMQFIGGKMEERLKKSKKVIA